MSVVFGAIYCMVIMIRFSYFNTLAIQLNRKNCNTGLSADYNAFVLAALWILQPLMSETLFTVLVFCSMLIMLSLNVSQMQVPKVQFMSTAFLIQMFCIFALGLCHMYIGRRK